MKDVLNPLVLDFVEWIAKEPRPYADVLDAWRTSCPRLTVWEDAVDRGYVVRCCQSGQGTRVEVTPSGAKFLRDHGRLVLDPFVLAKAGTQSQTP